MCSRTRAGASRSSVPRSTRSEGPRDGPPHPPGRLGAPRKAGALLDHRRHHGVRAIAPGRLAVDRAFPIVRHPAPETRTPVLVSVPHYGTEPLPHITRDDYREPSFETFAYGFADTFVGDLYGDLYKEGATVLATPFARMFVDVNRRRDDSEHHDGEVRSRRGVVRTHTMRDAPIFARPLALADLEARLRALYDPYYAAVEQLLGELRQAYGYALLLDGHTGSPRRMRDHQVIIGTCHGATCAPQLAAAAGAIFTPHGLDVHQDVSGYTGGNLVATYGRPGTRRVHTWPRGCRRSEEHTSELQSRPHLVCRLLLEKKKQKNAPRARRTCILAMSSLTKRSH